MTSPTDSPRTQDPARPPTTAPPSRRRWLLLALLVVATIAGRHLVSARPGPSLAPGPGLDPAISFETGDERVRMSGRLDRSQLVAGGDGVVRLELLLRGAELPAREISFPSDFVVVLDRSGSMAGAKIAQARAATLELLDRLQPGDRFALVTYASDVRLDIPFETADADRVASWRRRVEAVTAGGGTNMSGGLDRALELVAAPRRGPRRIVLLSDGLANEGDPTLEGLAARASTALARETVLSTVGIGLDFDERVMTTLADRAAGNFYFLEDTLENGVQLARLFDAELGATRETVASALEVHVDAAPGVRLVDAAGYPIASSAQGWSFRPGPLFAGQERRLWLTFAVPQEVGRQEVGRVRLAYRDGDRSRTLAPEERLAVVAVADPEAALASVDRDLWSRSSAGEEYGALQQAVAAHVREGRPGDALEAIRSYREEKAAMNETFGSAEVAARLEDAEALSQEVEDAFQGPDQAPKQKLLTKQNLAAGRDERRAGSKKAGAPTASGGSGR